MTVSVQRIYTKPWYTAELRSVNSETNVMKVQMIATTLPYEHTLTKLILATYAPVQLDTLAMVSQLTLVVQAVSTPMNVQSVNMNAPP